MRSGANSIRAARPLDEFGCDVRVLTVSVRTGSLAHQGGARSLARARWKRVFIQPDC